MRWLAVVVALAGCGKSKNACKAEAHELGTYLKAMDHTPTLAKIPDDVHLVSRPELASAYETVEAPVVMVKSTGLELRGEQVAVADLGAKLAAIAAKTQEDIDAGHMSPRFKWDHRIYIAIDRDAPWSEVANVAAAAAGTGYVKWIALFAKPSPVAAPPRSAVSPQLDKLLAEDNSSNKASELAHMMSDTIRSCPALGKSFGAVASEEATDRAQTLIEAIEPALIDCGCKVDLPDLRSLFFAVAGNLHPLATIELTLDNTAAPLTFPSATPWHEIAAKLVAETTWLVAS